MDEAAGDLATNAPGWVEPRIGEGVILLRGRLDCCGSAPCFKDSMSPVSLSLSKDKESLGVDLHSSSIGSGGDSETRAAALLSMSTDKEVDVSFQSL